LASNVLYGRKGGVGNRKPKAKMKHKRSKLQIKNRRLAESFWIAWDFDLLGSPKNPQMKDIFADSYDREPKHI
jgi:hypothetical protein